MPDTTNIFEEVPDEDTTGGRLSRAREASGLSPRELAWRLGVKIATIRAWECDRSQPSAHRIAKLAGILQVSLSWIMHGVGLGPSEEPDRASRSDATTREMTEQLARLRNLHVETGLLIEKLKGEFDRIATAR